ncbi:MAG: hypothetical protein HY892_10410, partial [Deltaproteobacteria bacterium]|nr:hypothetical protein [Deltaproteobacteria bacterium]
TPDYQVIFANRSFRNRFGELDGRHCYEYAFGFNEPCDFCESFQVLTTGQPHHWEVLSPDGSTIDAYDFPFTDADGSRLILEMHTDITARKQAEEELRQAHNKIKFFAAQSLTAQEMERKRIAGELHDGIASSLMAVKIRIDQLVEELKPGAGDPAALQDLGLKVLGINNEVRRLMVDLRPAILDDLGIVAALNWFCREYQKTYPAFAVENRISVLEDEVPDSIKTPIFRISQEAMNNIAKYSCASLVKMFLRKEGAKIRLTIADNGRGFDPETIRRGLGLSTMRERAELSGGSFDLEAETGKGTTIRAEWAE